MSLCWGCGLEIQGKDGETGEKLPVWVLKHGKVTSDHASFCDIKRHKRALDRESSYFAALGKVIPGK